MPYGEPTHGWWCNARTYRTRCKYCGESVFFFTCDCGSKVLFDELGWPWPEHRCVQYLIAQYGKEVVERAMSVQMMLPGRSAAEHQIASDYADVIHQHHEMPKPQPTCIIRREPVEGQTTCDVGIIREVIPRIDIFKKLRVPEDSVLGVRLLGPLGRDEFGQITIHIGSLAHGNVESYTCFVRRELLQSSGITRGDVVSFRLRAFSVPGRCVVWICEGLESPFP